MIKRNPSLSDPAFLRFALKASARQWLAFVFIAGIAAVFMLRPSGMVEAAPLEILYAEETTQQDSTSTSFVTELTIPAASITDNAKYILIASAAIRSDDPTGVQGFRIAEGSTEIVGTESRFELTTSTLADQSYGPMILEYDAPATAVDINYQQQAVAATEVGSDSIVMMMIRADTADFAEGTDWQCATQDNFPTGLSHSTTFVTRASITFTPDNANDDWLVIAHSIIEVDSVSINFETRIELDASFDYPEISTEGEDLTEERLHGLMRVWTLDATEHTFNVQTRDDSSAVNEHLFSSICAIRLNVFEDHDFLTTDVGNTFTTSDVFEETHALPSYTPTTDPGDTIVMAWYQCDAAGASTDCYIRAQVDGVDSPTGFGTHRIFDAYDGSDEGPAFTMNLQSRSGATDIDHDAAINHPTCCGAQSWEEATTVVFSVEIPDVAVDRRLTIISSGPLFYLLGVGVMLGLYIRKGKSWSVSDR